MLIRKNWREHLPWIVFILAGSAVSVFWYVSLIGASGWQGRPRGSQGALFWFGLAAGTICLFEFLLWPRKKLRTMRIGKVKSWMRAHIWLGLLVVPLVFLHSGFHFRNVEANLLLGLVVVVVLSGVWGLVMQQYLPQRMLDEVPAETIFSQIDHIANLMVEEADHLVVGTCGVSAADHAQPAAAVVSARAEEEVMAGAVAGSHFTVGAVRSIGGVQGKVLSSRAAVQPVPNSEPLLAFFNDVLANYLKRGRASGSELAVHARARAKFDELRVRLDKRAHDAVASLENLADQRRQLDQQARLHYWLHNWLWVHLPLSVALIILLLVHVVVTLRYWWPS